MGGTLTPFTWVQHPEISGLVPICAPVYLQDWRIRSLLPVIRRFADYYTANLEDVLDRSAVNNFVTREHRRRYDKIALPCLVELLELLRETKSRLGEIRQPILIVQASKDRVVPLGNADYIF